MLLHPLIRKKKFYLQKGEEALLKLDYKRRSRTWNVDVFHFVNFLKLAGYVVHTRVMAKRKRPYYLVEGKRIPMALGKQLSLGI